VKGRSFARWVSIVGHPFVMVLVMAGTAAARFQTPEEAARTLVIVALVTILPVGLLMVRETRRGAWENVDASNRRERPALLLWALGGLVALVAYVVLRRPDSFLLRGAVAALAMLVACAVATRWIKVSLHMAFGALATAALLGLGLRAGWALLAFLPLLAWSRLHLGRHRLVEVVAGSFAGAVTGVAMHAL
jgi:hypothetical protein